MSKLVSLFILFICFNLSAQESTRITGKLNDMQVGFLKQNYNWGSQDILIINFLQPKNNCHYDAYQNLSMPSKWWSKFYRKINLENIANRFIYSDAEAARRFIDSKIYFADKDNFLLNTLFNKFPYCHAVLVIHQSGNYELKGSEYREDEVTSYITTLRE